MIIFAIVLSSLALLAAGSGVVLIVYFDKKRIQEWRAALEKIRKDVDDLQSGVVPDFEKAKAATKAVNDFNAGVSGILGFDPLEAIKNQRNQRGEDD